MTNIEFIRRREFNEVRLEIKEPCKGATGGVLLACLLVVAACSCSPRAGSKGGETGLAPQVAYAPPGANAVTTAGDPETLSDSSAKAFAGALDFTLVNFTGSRLNAIHVSPHHSAGWEENVLGQDKLFDGEIVEIKFAPEEKTAAWDMRVEDKYGNNVEWKNLNLREISKITLRRGQHVMIAEAE